MLICILCPTCNRISRRSHKGRAILMCQRLSEFEEYLCRLQQSHSCGVSQDIFRSVHSSTQGKELANIRGAADSHEIS
jgi:hypothetical protein